MTSSRRESGIGLLLALTTTASFGVSGAFISPLLEAGWTPAAAVVARVLAAALVLAVPAAIALRGRWGLLWRARLRILLFGAAPVAGTQLAYFAAIDRIPIGTALLIEYLAPVLLVLAVWARSRRRPQLVVIAGSVTALAGLALVIAPGGGGQLDALGILFAALAAIGLASYFVLGALPDHGLPPVAMAASGLLVGGLMLAVVGAFGLLPFRAVFGEVALLGTTVSWLLPFAVVAVIGTALAYATGIAATARLGSRVASFTGLLEVVFAVLFAWLLLGQALAPLQLLGGALILGGIALVRAERPAAAGTQPAAAGTTTAGATTEGATTEGAGEPAPTPAAAPSDAPADESEVPRALTAP